MKMDTATLTLTRALAHLRAGDFSASELTAACLAVIEERNPALNAFALVTPPADFAQPTAPLRRLNGIPIAIKDLFDLSGYPTRAGSPLHFDASPALKDAAVVERLKAAGAVILGKTNTHEIALGITGINPHTGPVRNPHDPERITGGSSSGSAAAVASGMALAALGTDTGGSIRIPSALCGVVGFKPTFG
ncbi:MAG: amidase, partial [Anaerolineales bacterium]